MRISREFKRRLRRLLPLSDFTRHLYVVGAQKAGTTALHAYIKDHPQLACGDEKELSFFSRERIYARGLRYYRSCFPLITSGRTAFDASPRYLYARTSAERLHAYAPQAKIVILLREPVSRAFSAYNMYQQIFHQKYFRARLAATNNDWRTFLNPFLEREEAPQITDFLERELAIIASGEDAEEPSLLRRGFYTQQIVRYQQLFGQSNVLILFSDDLKNNPSDAIGRVLDFAGLDPLERTEFPLVHSRDYTANPAAHEQIARAGHDWFAEDACSLAHQLGLPVPWLNPAPSIKTDNINCGLP